MKSENHWNSYGVFCMAMSMAERNERELDLLWADAISKYEAFCLSEYNDQNKSELDCIHEFLNEISKP